MYILGFLFSLHCALPVYINSSFLKTLVNEESVGLIYTISSVITIIAFVFIPSLLKKIGNYKTIVIILLLELASLLGLAFLDAPWLLIGFFMLSFIAIALINFNMDVFLEKLSTHNEMGRVRGFFLTSGNTAWIVGQVGAGLLLTQGDEYWRIYIAAAMLIIPVIFILMYRFDTFKDPEYVRHPFFKTVLEIWRSKDVLGSFIIQFIQQFFYAWMIIYAPIYLHEYIGFSWEQIGIMFSIMLLPFVIFDIPMGRYIDRTHREKGILALGFLCMAISTASIPYIQSKSIVVWTLILVATRIGASLVEIGSEAHFFRHINPTSIHIMSVYRTMRPWAYCIAPIIATIILYFTESYYGIFIVLGFVLLYGIRHVIALRAHPRS